MGHQHAVMGSLKPSARIMPAPVSISEEVSTQSKTRKDIYSIWDKHKHDQFYNVFRRAIILSTLINLLTLTASEMKGRPECLREKKKVKLNSWAVAWAKTENRTAFSACMIFIKNILYSFLKMTSSQKPSFCRGLGRDWGGGTEMLLCSMTLCSFDSLMKFDSLINPELAYTLSQICHQHFMGRPYTSGGL